MTWISLICLLALTSSAFGRSAYGGADFAPQTPILTAGWGQQMIPKTFLPTVSSYPVSMHTLSVVPSAYQQQQPIQQSYGAQMTLPKTLPVQSYASASQGGYGSAQVMPQSDQQVTVPVVTEADMICQGHQAEQIIPIDNNHKFIVCLSNGKGVEQQCPTGLLWHPTTGRCERNLGQLEDACLSQPCLNGGQCLTAGSSFQCQCAPGFEGVFCELDARICQTQQPCGSAPDTKCQSFRVGAGLPYICIFQGGLAYGLNAQQVVPSPCQDTDVPQPLAVSKNGFVMCDVGRMFVESCPGGTIWDDVEKACSWPDQQSGPQAPKTLTSGYGYSTQLIPQQQPVQSYGAQVTIPQQQPVTIPQRHFAQPTQSYGAQVTLPQQQQPTQSYGAQVTIPQQQQQQQQPTQSYGAQVVIPQQQPVMIPQKHFAQPTQSYGAQVTLPQQQQQQPTQSYGAQVTIPQQQQQTITAPKQFIQPTQTYGAQMIIPQQQQQQQPALIAPQQLVQPTQSYGADVQVLQQQQQPQMIAHKDVPSVIPFGAAHFTNSY